MSVAEQVLDTLARVTQVDEVRTNPDLRLYDLHLLDSLSTVELMVSFSEQFGVELSPAEFEPEQWATPSKIVHDIEQRVGAGNGR
jgi:D-alanine--poly(phosphoribitol) ligase subunit 2